MIMLLSLGQLWQWRTMPRTAIPKEAGVAYPRDHPECHGRRRGKDVGRLVRPIGSGWPGQLGSTCGTAPPGQPDRRFPRGPTDLRGSAWLLAQADRRRHWHQRLPQPGTEVHRLLNHDRSRVGPAPPPAGRTGTARRASAPSPMRARPSPTTRSTTTSSRTSGSSQPTRCRWTASGPRFRSPPSS
jgi:hypothetical protein